jgi:predicted GNAT family N-acyltransferase
VSKTIINKEKREPIRKFRHFADVYIHIDALWVGDYHIPMKAGAPMEIIKVTNESQLKQCMEIRRRVFIEEQSVPENEEIDDHDRLDDPIATHFLFYEEGRLIGTIRCLRKSDTILKIGRVAVSSEERGKGFGYAMMNLVEAFHPECGRYVLDAQTHAIPFYLKCGYTINGDVFMDAGIPHQHMEKINNKVA